ncbi:MAG: cytochrome C biogenesis protein [Candidatus Aminicenantes bacterium]|nr:MAG: cytochrome C biogenesis protein [Candidatus Aminicenantes bacterium]
MIKLFSALSHVIEGAPLIAIGASFIWGILSIILSPCHLTSIPLIIGYLSNQRELSTKKAYHLSIVFSIGILISIAVIGGITAAAGRILGDIGKLGNYVVAMVFLIFGLNLLGILPLNFPGLGTIKSQRKGYFSVLSLGLVFGLALGPCTFAFMAPMLGIVFNMTAKNLPYGLVLLSAFALGHCAVIIVAGTSTRLVQHITKWDDQSKGITIIRKICGILVLLGGIYLVYSTF